MSQFLSRPREVNVQKAALYAIVVNAMEIAVSVGFALYVVLVDIRLQNPHTVQALAVFGALAASWGALLDIREALKTRGRVREIEDLQTSNLQMDALNKTLRAQRHDFLNHLQVVYSLLEMKEYADATDYLEKVYGEIRSVQTVLRTRSTAVNALLKVKLAAAEERGVPLRLDIKSSLDGLGMPGWELCRVLSNLIDNAMDAVKATPGPSVSLSITEDLRAFSFTVSNNGPAIDPALLPHIFEAGVSTKGEGRGMGLSIVRQTLEAHHGAIRAESDARGTAFIATVPKQADAPAHAG